MPRRKKQTRAEKQAARDRKLAFIIIEVARATNEGRSVNQQDIKRLVRQRWAIKLPDATLSGYVSRLANSTAGRIWLSRDGQQVNLHSEDTILTDSNSIKALLIAAALVDDDDRIVIARWCEKCANQHRYSPENCRKYISDYTRCGYAVAETGNNRMIQLELRTINEDMFYLRQAAKAKLKARPRRTLTPAPGR